MMNPNGQHSEVRQAGHQDAEKRGNEGRQVNNWRELQGDHAVDWRGQCEQGEQGELGEDEVLRGEEGEPVEGRHRRRPHEHQQRRHGVGGVPEGGDEHTAQPYLRVVIVIVVILHCCGMKYRPQNLHKYFLSSAGYSHPFY